jgi:hypothetical protein
VLEGRRTFGNIMKYIMMGTSSNFGNMFSMAGAALFLPFLPMLPTQILLNNSGDGRGGQAGLLPMARSIRPDQESDGFGRKVSRCVSESVCQECSFQQREGLLCIEPGSTNPPRKASSEDNPCGAPCRLATASAAESWSILMVRKYSEWGEAPRAS